MKFLRLADPLLAVLYQDAEIIAIDKAYGFNAHTNDCKIEHSEFIEDGLIEIFEKQLGQKLHIIHRLDQTTTGVMIFGKSAEAAKKYAEFFFDRKVKKTYWFVSASSSKQQSFVIEQKIIHKGRELEAKTNLILQNKFGGFELWKANPLTGRNHQIRIHAQSAGVSILGDEKYGGIRFPFLCLHNQEIQFPNGLTLTSHLPVYFENLELLQDPLLCQMLFEIDRRQRLFPRLFSENQSLRLIQKLGLNTTSELSMDQYGKILVLNWRKESCSETDLKRFNFISQYLQKPIHTPNGLNDPLKHLAANFETWTANENKALFELRKNSRKSSGLSTNQRLQRNWVSQNSQGKLVLNLFSYTGSYSVAAALGAARQVTSVESSKSALAWSQKNFALNALSVEGHLFYCRDSLSYLEQARNKKIKYDLITCDLPSFFRREKEVFKIETGLEAFLGNCLQCLKPKGALLLSISFEGLLIDDLRRLFLKVQKDLKISKLEINCLLPALDLELPDDRAQLKSFLLQLSGD